MLLKDRRLSLFDDEDLLDELANVRLRETSPGVLRMDHDPDKHDDRAIALALAALALVERPASGGCGTVLASLPPRPRLDVAGVTTVTCPWERDRWADLRGRT